MADESDKQLHIVVFPWLAFGHMIPFLELAKLIAQKGHRVSFVSTPRNIDRLPKLSPNIAPLVDFVKLPLAQVENLPENAESTSDLPYNKVRYLKIAYDCLEQPVAQFLEDSVPDWIVHDFSAHWLGPITAKLNIRSTYFCIIPMAALCNLVPPSFLRGQDDQIGHDDFTVKPPWVHIETAVRMAPFEIKRMFQDLVKDGGNVSDLYRAGAVLRNCDLLAIRSCDEFEPEWLDLGEEVYQTKVIPVGLLPTTTYDDGTADSNAEWLEMKEWLDKQSKGSVVYIAFGSETKPNQEELTEIALGLELSNLPFFWVLKKQRGSSDTEVIELPDGFEDRTRGRGVVCTSWAPQVKILSHESVGGLLIHSGWSSVVEAVHYEKAIVLLPFLGDQGLIARLLEEKKVGYAIQRNEDDGSFTKELVAESLRLVMVEDGGSKGKELVKQMKILFGEKDMQDVYVHKFLNYLQTYR